MHLKSYKLPNVSKPWKVGFFVADPLESASKSEVYSPKIIV
jgi:hypothetical protein